MASDSFKENQWARQKASTVMGWPQRRGVHRAGFYCTVKDSFFKTQRKIKVWIDTLFVSEVLFSIYFNGWKVHCMPFEIGARGFICNSFTIFFSRLGAGCRLRKKAAADAAIAASLSSAWIWNKFQASSRLSTQTWLLSVHPMGGRSTACPLR